MSFLSCAFPPPPLLLCMFCRWKRQPEDGNSGLQQLSEFHNLLVVQCSVRRASGGDIMWTISYERGNWVFQAEEKISSSDLWKTFSGFSWVKTGKIFIWDFSDTEQASEVFSSTPPAMVLIGIHFIWPFNYFGILFFKPFFILKIYFKIIH